MDQTDRDEVKEILKAELSTNEHFPKRKNMLTEDDFLRLRETLRDHDEEFYGNHMCRFPFVKPDEIERVWPTLVDLGDATIDAKKKVKQITKWSLAIGIIFVTLSGVVAYLVGVWMKIKSVIPGVK